MLSSSQDHLEAFMDVKKWAEIQESLLRAQLKTIRQFLTEGEQRVPKPRKKGKSQMTLIYDILFAAQRPLHVTEIITLAKQNFQVDLDRESIVSALTKKVRSGRMFKRVAPNTFAILESDATNNQE
jgi:hypothetical protein